MSGITYVGGAVGGGLSAAMVARVGSVSRSITEFGAKVDGVTDDTAAVQAAHDALPSAGGTIVIPDGNLVCGAVTFTKPTRVTIGRGNVTVTGSSDWITTNANIVVQGHTALETLIHSVSGHSGVRITGTWAQSGFTKPQFLVQDIGFVGGKHGVDTSGLTLAAGFEEGHFEFNRCRFDATTDYGIFLDSSVYYSFLYDCQYQDTCYGWAYIRDNTETRIYNSVGLQSTSGSYGYFLDGASHVEIIGDSWLGFTPNTKSTVLIRPRNFDNSHDSPRPGSGIVTIKNVKGGAERELDFNSDRVWIDIESIDDPNYTPTTLDPDYAAWNCCFENIELDACAGIGCSAASRTTNVATLTTSRAHNIKVGEIVHVVGCSDTSFNGTWTTVSGTTGSTIKYNNTGADVASVGGPPLIASGSQSAIRLKNPTAQCTFRDLNFAGYAYWFDDAYDWSDTPDDLMGQSVLINCKGTGPLGKSFQEFKQGGRGFSAFMPNERSPLPDSRAPRKELRNRVKNTMILHAAGDWTEADHTVTTGQTDSFGGSTAILLTRNGASATYAQDGVGKWLFGSGVFTTVDTTGIPKRSYLHVELKSNTLTTAQCAITDTTNERLQINKNFSLTSDWKVYSTPFAWSPTLGTCSITISAGSRFAEVGSVYVGRVWVDDYDGDFIPTAGAMVSDTSACAAFPRDIVLLNGTKIKAAAGSTNYLHFTGGNAEVAPRILATDGSQGEFSSSTGSNYVTASSGFVGVGGHNPSEANIIAGANNSSLGFFGSLGHTKQAVTGALSSVTDANAKAVLTSIIAALASASGYNLVTNSTT